MSRACSWGCHAKRWPSARGGADTQSASGRLRVTPSRTKLPGWASDTFLLRMRPPRRLGHQLHLLAHHQRSELRDEISNEVLVVATLLQRRKPELGIELLRLSRFADVERVGTHFVECHRILLFLPSSPSGDVRHRQSLAGA